MPVEGSGRGFLSLESDSDKASAASVTRRGYRWPGFVLLGLAFGLLAWSAVANREAEPSQETSPIEEAGDDLLAPAEEPSSLSEAALVAQSVPRALLVVELFVAEPSASSLRELFSEAGGFDGLEIATAEGAFDLVRFDPLDPDRLLASHRSSYGEGRNNDSNEIWTVHPDGSVDQQVWAPNRSHDFAHFNVDGSAIMWVHAGGSGFAPRRAVFLGNGLVETRTTEPLYASRFTAANGTLFALTGNGDYYSHEDKYVALVADAGNGLVTLAGGDEFGWIDNPTPDILVAYPSSVDGRTVVWDTATLERLPDHPLSGRNSRAAAVSDDLTRAVVVEADGRMEVLDMLNGLSMGTFGEVEVAGVDQPITLNEDGTIAITVEHSGRVTIWWVGGDQPVASIAGDAGQPRWVSERFAPTAASAVAANGSRVAVRKPARPSTANRYVIVDTSIVSWIARACERAQRPLSEPEAAALGLPPERRACEGS